MKKSKQIDSEERATSLVEYAHDRLTPFAADWLQRESLKTSEEFVQASEALKQLKSSYNDAESQYKELTDPLKKVVKIIDGKWKPIKQTFEATETYIKNLLLQYRQVEQAKLLEKAEKEAKKVEKKSPEMAADIRAIALTRQVTPVVEGQSFRKHWKHEVMEPSMVPDEFWIIDEKRLAAYAKAMKENAKVDGVRFYTEEVAYSSGASED